MAVIWKKTNFLGVRFREHASRKHGVRADRCFSIRYKLDGKDKEEVAGWGSEGMTAEKAFKMLSLIRDNIRLGVEPRSIAAMRQANASQEAEKEKARRRREKEQLTFAEFWESEYLPIEGHKKIHHHGKQALAFFKMDSSGHWRCAITESRRRQN